MVSQVVMLTYKTMTQQCGEWQRAKVTHYMTNADVGGPEYANVSLCGESGGYDDAAKR